MLPGVIVAPWVIFEGRKSLSSNLVGLLESLEKGLSQIFPWLEAWWGKLPYKIKMLDSSMVWMRFASSEEAIEVLARANDGKDSPFLAIERWMEVLSRPPTPPGGSLAVVWRSSSPCVEGRYF